MPSKGKVGRPPESATGESRKEWRIAVAPSARAKAEMEAKALGMSPSAYIEGLILREK